MTNPFCQSCNRLRVTAGRRLRPCLTDETEIDLGSAFQAARPEEAIAEALREAAALKPARGPHLSAGCPVTSAMQQVGG